MSYNTKGNIM